MWTNTDFVHFFFFNFEQFFFIYSICVCEARNPNLNTLTYSQRNAELVGDYNKNGK